MGTADGEYKWHLHPHASCEQQKAKGDRSEFAVWPPVLKLGRQDLYRTNVETTKRLDVWVHRVRNITPDVAPEANNVIAQGLCWEGKSLYRICLWHIERDGVQEIGQPRHIKAETRRILDAPILTSNECMHPQHGRVIEKQIADKMDSAGRRERGS